MTFLFWAYTVVWAGIVAYLAFLAMRLSRVADRLARLEATASRPRGDSGEPGGRPVTSA